MRQTAPNGYEVKAPLPQPDLSGLRSAEAREEEAKYKTELGQWDKGSARRVRSPKPTKRDGRPTLHPISKTGDCFCR